MPVTGRVGVRRPNNDNQIEPQQSTPTKEATNKILGEIQMVREDGGRLGDVDGKESIAQSTADATDLETVALTSMCSSEAVNAKLSQPSYDLTSPLFSDTTIRFEHAAVRSPAHGHDDSTPVTLDGPDPASIPNQPAQLQRGTADRSTSSVSPQELQDPKPDRPPSPKLETGVDGGVDALKQQSVLGPTCNPAVPSPKSPQAAPAHVPHPQHVPTGPQPHGAGLARKPATGTRAMLVSRPEGIGDSSPAASQRESARSRRPVDFFSPKMGGGVGGAKLPTSLALYSARGGRSKREAMSRLDESPCTQHASCESVAPSAHPVTKGQQYKANLLSATDATFETANNGAGLATGSDVDFDHPDAYSNHAGIFALKARCAHERRRVSLQGYIYSRT